MKFFVQARKDGYNVLYPKPTPIEFFKFAGDIRRIDRNSAEYLGKYIYSIAFTVGGSIFTEHVIIQDVQRAGLGNVGFSVFIPYEKKMEGVAIKSLLDSLIKTYCQKYCPDNYLDKKQEDWILFANIANSYDSELNNVSSCDLENMQSGDVDEAFIYYSSDAELQNYFETPYQEEYQPYRQILFINKELEGKPENPLNALRNSGIDLTGKIDLENPKYKLIFNSNASNGVRITVKANGTTISNNNKFRRKNELEISWTKQYYKTEIQRGKCFELTDKFKNIDKEAAIVTIKEIELEPEEKTITFEIKDSFGNLINDAEILISNSLDTKFKPQEWKKINLANVVTPFIGENLGKSWIVTVKKGENLISEPHRIDFEKDCVGNVELILQPIKKVAVFAVEARNEANNITNIKIWLSNKSFQDGSEIVFRGDEIEKKWIIKVSHNDYEEETITDYYPSTGKNPLYVTLRKKSKQIAHLNSNNKGNELDENKKGQRKKQFYKKPAFISASIVLVLAIILGVWIIIPNDNPEPLQVEVNSDSITNYLKDNELFEVKLFEYRDDWVSHLRDISKKQQDSIKSESSKKKSILSWLNRLNEDANNPDEQSLISEDIFNNDTLLQKIDSAIVLRDSINVLNFEYLKKQNYSAKQKKFKESIGRVKSSDYELIRDRLTSVSDYSLEQIADSINTILDSKKTKIEQRNAVIVESESLKKQVNKTSPPKAETEIRNTKPSASQNDEITSYLKGNELKLSKLEGYLDKDNKYEESIKLCIEFWDKVRLSRKKDDFGILLIKVNNDKYLKNSLLKSYLSKICKDSKSFEEHFLDKINRIPINRNTTLNKL